MKHPSPRSTQIRDQLAAALRDAPLPLSTAQLARISGLPTWECTWSFPCSRACVGDRIRDGHLVLACGEPTGWRDHVLHIVEMMPTSSSVYPHLRRLETLGITRRIKLPGFRRVYWEFVADESDATMDRLIAAMED